MIHWQYGVFCLIEVKKNFVASDFIPNQLTADDKGLYGYFMEDANTLEKGNYTFEGFIEKYWDKIELYKQELSYVVPQKDVVEQWEAKRKGDINAELNEIINYIKTPEGQKYVVKLNKEDGR